MSLLVVGLVVVTGASSGLGAAFARLLSARGHEVVLVGRDRSRLEDVARSLPGPSRVVTADLTEAAGLAAVESILGDVGRPVELLVNNAGAGFHGSFVDHEPDLLDATVALNATAVVRLSRAALESMLPRRRGGVITMSSLAGPSPQPGMATYSATKAFVDSWSSSVADEIRGSGVVLTCARPGWVRTDFHARSGQSVGHVGEREWMNPDQVVQRVLDAHGRGRTSVVILPEVSKVGGAVRAARRGAARVSWVRRLRNALRRSAGPPG